MEERPDDWVERLCRQARERSLSGDSRAGVARELASYFADVQDVPPPAQQQQESGPSALFDSGRLGGRSGLTDRYSDPEGGPLLAAWILQEAGELQLATLRREREERVAAFIRQEAARLELRRTHILKHRAVLLSRVLSSPDSDPERQQPAASGREARAPVAVARSRVGAGPAGAGAGGGMESAAASDGEGEDTRSRADSPLWEMEEDTAPHQPAVVYDTADDTDGPAVSGRGFSKRAGKGGGEKEEEQDKMLGLLSSSMPIAIPERSGHAEEDASSDDEEQTMMPPHTLAQASGFLEPKRPDHRRFSVV